MHLQSLVPHSLPIIVNSVFPTYYLFETPKVVAPTSVALPDSGHPTGHHQILRGRAKLNVLRLGTWEASCILNFSYGTVGHVLVGVHMWWGPKHIGRLDTEGAKRPSTAAHLADRRCDEPLLASYSSTIMAGSSPWL